MTFKEDISVLVYSAGRRLGSVLTKVKLHQDLGFCTQLYKSYVCPFSDYASGIWGFRDLLNCNTVYYRVI